MDVHREIANRQTKFSCIKRKAQEKPEEVFTSLAHHLTEEFLAKSYRKLRKSAVSGLDEVNAYDYLLNFSQRIENLHTRLRSGQYHAPNIHRVWIDKGEGKKRPLRISTTEDKIVQRAVTDILNLIFEQDFYDFSYGFRPRRSAHQALKSLRDQSMKRKIRWMLDCDIQGCFDNFDHNILLSFLNNRIKDKRIIQLIK